ncbi:hypothetical protein BGZ98_003038 [Dissophora globulifera]|uniref:ATPase inhibitor, mitochondrial n=1 Tax=Dissophora globulifera TaxID=979702 RepID=A0A9P6RH44_9FUNG|nr:hypothetical protein BGZ98_003038 [Dissophora globulifera]KAG0318526.1 hypothetical protein BGZ99_005623 [Dissophora globulifera]
MLRTTTTAAVRAFKPVQVSAVARRNYSDKFGDKEKAEEAQYIRAKEAEQTKKLKQELAKKEKELADLKKENNKK